MAMAENGNNGPATGNNEGRPAGAAAQQSLGVVAQ
jgi:hypothetical protein